MCPSWSTTTSRNVIAWIGTAIVFWRVDVVITAVHVNPGRTFGHLAVDRDDDLEVGRALGRPAPAT